MIEGKKYLEARINWFRGKDPEYPYEARHDGHKLQLRLNDFPDEELYALLEDGKEIANIDDWPDSWNRSSERETILNAKVSHFANEKILIVADQEEIRTAIKQVLKDESYTIGEASTVAEAIRLVAEQEWNVAIVDLFLPGKSGLELIKEMKNLKPDIPVLILSMNADVNSMSEAVRAGAAGYILEASANVELVKALGSIRKGETYLSHLVVKKLIDEFYAGEASIKTLTPRQREVLELMAEGQSTKQIAMTLNITERTVEEHKAHVLNILERLRNLGRISLIPLEEQ